MRYMIRREICETGPSVDGLRAGLDPAHQALAHSRPARYYGLGNRAAMPWVGAERVDHVAHVPARERRAYPVADPELRRDDRSAAQVRRPPALARPAAHAWVVAGQPGATGAEADLPLRTHLIKPFCPH